MRKTFVLLALVASCAVAQERTVAMVSQRTQAPGSARYEIVESGNVVIRLDRYTGETMRRVDDRPGTRWEVVDVPGRPVAGAVPRFQIVTRESGGMYLLDTDTGFTWVSSVPDPRNPRALFLWKPFWRPD
jgi:hypothetical protein